VLGWNESDKQANNMSTERNVHPIAFLTSNTGDVLKQAQVSQEPVLITVDGKVEAVVQDVVS
jgi:hypothetical protein